MKIKICGIRRTEDVQYLNDILPDYTGFVFADTRRKVTKEQAAVLRNMLDRRVRAFGVFVNAPVWFVAELAEERIIDGIQLHGDEDENYIREVRKTTDVPVIKAVRVKDALTVKEADKLSCDYLLLDTYSKDKYGGTGETFSWSMIPAELRHSYFLAGGLNAANIRSAMEAVSGRGNCLGLDLSGGVETDGYKDREKIKQVVEIVRTYQAQ